MVESNGAAQRRQTWPSHRAAGPSDEEAMGSNTLAADVHFQGHGDLATNSEESSVLQVVRKDRLYLFWARFTRKGKTRVGVLASFKAIALSSWLNLFLVFIPLSWISHFHPRWPGVLTFILSFLAIIPLEGLFDWGGEQMSLYCGKDVGDLIIITLNNTVEATLSIILLKKCELKLLQSTIVGVVVLHLLLIPGTAFITGGARVWEQDLHPHVAQLNHTLLTIGVLSLLLPAALFAALDRGATIATETVLISDSTRANFLQMSRGVAVILLIVYICSRIFLYNPPGKNNSLSVHPLAPAELKHEELHLAETDPDVNQWVCLGMLAIAIGLVAATAEWLVESIDFVKEAGGIQEEWFGLILLPFVSFSADGAVAILFFIRFTMRIFLGSPAPPAALAKARAIDLSIQFTLFWMPFLVLLGWWSNKPMTLLFDFFEVALLLGACFLVNYVTADAKTNWAEGVVLVSFYFMIAVCGWSYSGQPEIVEMLACGSVAEAVGATAGESVP